MSAAERYEYSPLYVEEAPDHDWCTEAGAERLCKMIQQYWAERGGVVQAMPRSAGFHPALRSARYDVRSDMRNGWPALRALPAPEQDR